MYWPVVDTNSLKTLMAVGKYMLILLHAFNFMVDFANY